MDATAEAIRDRRLALERRRRAGLVLGGFLAFLLGGWPGLGAACLLVGVVGLIDYVRAHR